MRKVVMGMTTTLNGGLDDPDAWVTGVPDDLYAEPDRLRETKVVVSTYVTLDGVFEDPGGAEEFEPGGWSNPFFNEEAEQYARDQLWGSDALLLGRPTKSSRRTGPTWRRPRATSPSG